jgi:transglutaminase-like putative cysteine protease
VSYYQYDHLKENSLPQYGVSLREYETACREFAYANYTDLPVETRTAMQEIIAEAVANAGVDLGSMSRNELIIWVRDYIKGAAEYDLQFPDFPEGVDKAIYFLTVAKRGVCRHFATSAVVMYRALGIPARYTVGYVSDSVEGETVEVSALQAHAWVEVYIDGIGWVSVDPTGGGPEGDGGNGGTPPQTEKAGTVTIVPYSIKKVYSGKPVSCGEGQFWIKSGADTLPEGYSISVTVEGSRTKVGVGVSKITAVVIRDADGNDITERYDIVCEDGVIEVMPIKIVVYTASASKNYDGRKLTAEECSVIMGKLLDGHSIKGYGYSYIVGIGSEPNTVEEIVVYDANGQDVTDCYEIEIRLGTLTITSGGG